MRLHNFNQPHSHPCSQKDKKTGLLIKAFVTCQLLRNTVEMHWLPSQTPMCCLLKHLENYERALATYKRALSLPATRPLKEVELLGLIQTS